MLFVIKSSIINGCLGRKHWNNKYYSPFEVLKVAAAHNLHIPNELHYNMDHHRGDATGLEYKIIRIVVAGVRIRYPIMMMYVRIHYFYEFVISRIPPTICIERMHHFEDDNQTIVTRPVGD